MKKIFVISIAALAAFAAISCQKENTAVCAGEPVEMSFTASTEGTKAYLELPKFIWEATDQIAVFDGSAKNTFTIKSITDNTPLFEGTAAAGADYYAVYPASAGKSLAGGVLTVTVPAAQSVGTHAVDASALVTVAKAEGSVFNFKNVCSLLKVKAPYDGIKAINISGSKLAGDAKVAVDGTLSSVENAADQIRVTTADNTCFVKDSTYLVAVLPGANATFKVSFEMNDSGVQATAREASAAVTIERNHTYNLVNGSADAEKFEAWRHIKSVEEFLAWGAMAEASRDAYSVCLDSDINMDGKTWTPFVLKTNFDGNNHKIYNLVLNVSTAGDFQGIFKQFYGSKACNLILGSADGANYDGKSKVTISTGSTKKAGVLFGELETACTIENITNFIPLEYTKTSSSSTHLGAICAVVKKQTTFTNCTNNGNISYLANTGSQKIRIAACAAYLDGGPVTCTNCTNNGDFSSVAPNALSVGGIFGESGHKITATGCVNTGDIIVSNNTSTSGQLSMGGIVAVLISGSDISGTEISNCSNSGQIGIEDEEHPTTRNIFIGGIVGDCAYGKSLKGNTNTGEMYCNATRNACRMGGIVGKAGSGVTFTDNVSTGNFTSLMECGGLCWGAIAGILGGNITANNNGAAGKCVYEYFENGDTEKNPDDILTEITKINAENFADHLWTLNGKTVTTVTPNYFAGK